ncbi:MAG: hypothetical protein B1H11_00720 [Desulfobacteraceae bacterium 4484_190.1]|nr:MAG: hypothetical protein B1H11_00720 [Desulfobacteraceae bacterium 4484_190.1]
MFDVGVVKYEEPMKSLQKAVDLAGGIDRFSPDSKVVIKPNLVIWHEGVNFPKYAVLTTSRLIEDMVKLLVEHGARDISIVEGSVELEKNPKHSIVDLAAKGLGYDVLKKRYGVKVIDALKGSFTKVPIDDVKLNINTNILEADYVVDMPVLKTHSQCMVSLGIKNLKGMLNIASRKLCHNADPDIDLNYHVSKFVEMIPVSFTVIDGIYTSDRGPSYNGRARRSNIIVASKDLLSADLVGAKVLGIDPQTIPHLAKAASYKNRPADLSDVKVKGNVDIMTALKPHKWEFEQNEKGDMPLWMERAGIKGITLPKQDLTICTYCAFFINHVFMGILMAKNKDRSFDDIEILDGKIQEPTPGHKHTLLVGQCQVNLNKDNPVINHCVTIPGCPASKKNFLKAFEELNIELPDNFLEWMEKSPELVHMKKYEGNPDFDPTFYTIQ